MDDIIWQKQAKDQPLFGDLLWSRPENKRTAGKLLIAGGNLHGFAAPAAAFAAAGKAGVGSCRVLLPESLRRTVGQLLAADFVAANPSGAFSKKALADFLDAAAWADGILLAGDFGRNSETAVLLDKFTAKYTGPLTIAGDGLDYFINQGSAIVGRSKTTLVINLGKLQKLAKNNGEGIVIRHQDNLAELVRKLAEWSQTSGWNIVTRHESYLVVASGGQVSTTPWTEDSRWQVELPAYVSVWGLQNPGRAFEAITTAVYDFAS